MQKNRTRSFQGHATVSQPRRLPVVHMDTMAITPDVELIGRLTVLEDEKERVSEPRPWEEEIAYIKRELQIRRSRREAHTAYVNFLERELAAIEFNLPFADTDNTVFMKTIGVI